MGTAAVGTPGPATPIGDPARFERAEIETPRCLPAASPGRGEPGVAGVGRGHVVPKASGFREPHREVDSQLCESVSLRGRLALARVTPPRCTPVTRQAGGRALLDKPAPANF